MLNFNQKVVTAHFGCHSNNLVQLRHNVSPTHSFFNKGANVASSLYVRELKRLCKMYLKDTVDVLIFSEFYMPFNTT